MRDASVGSSAAQFPPGSWPRFTPGTIAVSDSPGQLCGTFYTADRCGIPSGLLTTSPGNVSGLLPNGWQVRARVTIEAMLRSMGGPQANPPVSPAIAGGASLVEARAPRSSEIQADPSDPHIPARCPIGSWPGLWERCVFPLGPKDRTASPDAQSTLQQRHGREARRRPWVPTEISEGAQERTTRVRTPR